MAESPIPRVIPEEFVIKGSWRCVVCGETKRVADDHSGEFPTARGRKGGPQKVWLTECRACRDTREENKGGDGSPPPWKPDYRGPLRGWDGNSPESPEMDPRAQGEPREVVDTFSPVTLEMAAAAPPEEDEEEIADIHQEGAVTYRRHRIRERDRRLRARKLDEVRGRSGQLACEACGIEIETVYDTPDGAVYECHHLVPLHVTGETQTTLSDVVLLCPTCHRAAHRTRPWPGLLQMQAWHGR